MMFAYNKLSLLPNLEEVPYAPLRNTTDTNMTKVISSERML